MRTDIVWNRDEPSDLRPYYTCVFHTFQQYIRVIKQHIMLDIADDFGMHFACLC